MYLLNVEKQRLEKFVPAKVPPYAILSHCWNSEDEEVQFKDINANKSSFANVSGFWGNSRNKKGYDKIRICCAQAKNDGLDYVWIDTFCINRDSSTELAESLLSMFKYYQESSICYAILPEVLQADGLEISRWFTRGWTLQELIAPWEVIFFNVEGQRLGSRYEFAERISRVTKIDQALLRGDLHDNLRSELANFSVAQRMSWAGARSTSRIEDTAYSLMGIFGVTITPRPGESRGAFIRLQRAIASQYPDLSILAWSGNRAEPKGLLRLPFALSPESFLSCSGIRLISVPQEQRGNVGDMNLSPVGMKVTAPVVEIPNVGLFMLLNCHDVRGDDSDADDTAEEDTDGERVLALRIHPEGAEGAKGFQYHLSTEEQKQYVFNVGHAGARKDYRRLRSLPKDVTKIPGAIIRHMPVVLNMKYDSLDTLINAGSNNLNQRLQLRIPTSWTVLACHPETYWNTEESTFDLLQARKDNRRQAASAQMTTSARIARGLPVRGAVVIKADKCRSREIVFWFQQQSVVLDTTDSVSFGLLPDIIAYDKLAENENQLPSGLKSLPFNTANNIVNTLTVRREPGASDSGLYFGRVIVFSVCEEMILIPVQPSSEGSRFTGLPSTTKPTSNDTAPRILDPPGDYSSAVPATKKHDNLRPSAVKRSGDLQTYKKPSRSGWVFEDDSSSDEQLTGDPFEGNDVYIAREHEF